MGQEDLDRNGRSGKDIYGIIGMMGFTTILGRFTTMLWQSRLLALILGIDKEPQILSLLIEKGTAIYCNAFFIIGTYFWVAIGSGNTIHGREKFVWTDGVLFYRVSEVQQYGFSCV